MSVPRRWPCRTSRTTPTACASSLRRVGSEWQPIGWDEAFALVASRLGEIRERHGNDAVAVYQGNPSVHNYGLMTHSNYFLGLLKTRNRFSATSRSTSCRITWSASRCTAMVC